jgi:hypothetical protein
MSRFPSILEFAEKIEHLLKDRSKAELLCSTLTRHIERAKENLYKEALMKGELDKAAVEYMANIDRNRQDQINTHNNEFITIKREVEGSFRDLRSSRQKTLEGIQNTRTEAIFEFFSERLKQKELLANHETRINQLIKGRADQEVGLAKERIISAKQDLYMHFTGNIFATGAFILALFRVLM